MGRIFLTIRGQAGKDKRSRRKLAPPRLPLTGSVTQQGRVSQAFCFLQEGYRFARNTNEFKWSFNWVWLPGKLCCRMGGVLVEVFSARLKIMP